MSKRCFFNVIQANWRGYRFRKSVKEVQARRLAEVRAKMSEAAKNATEAKKLCNRTAYALEFLYQSKDMSCLIGALADLGMIKLGYGSPEVSFSNTLLMG